MRRHGESFFLFIERTEEEENAPRHTAFVPGRARDTEKPKGINQTFITGTKGRIAEERKQ